MSNILSNNPSQNEMLPDLKLFNARCLLGLVWTGRDSGGRDHRRVPRIPPSTQEALYTLHVYVYVPHGHSTHYAGEWRMLDVNVLLK